MSKQKYNIKWHTYSDQLQVTMRKLMTSPDFTDVTFVCEDKKLIRAHKNILNECSPALKEIFQIERNMNSIIYLKGINHSDMELILHFIYLGEATFHEERLNDFLSVAKSLEIKGLSSEEEIKTPESSNQDSEVIPIDEIDNLLNEESTAVPSPEVITDNISAENDKEVSQSDESVNQEIPGPKIKSPDTQSKIGDTLNQLLDEDEQRENKSSSDKEEDTTKALNDTMPLEKSEQEDKKLITKIECKECSKEFEDTGSLYLHQQAVHAPKVFICEFCPYEATTKRSFEMHVQRQHARFHCSRCTYRATSKLNLVTHVKLNHDHQKYTCDQCDYQTTKQINLANHVKAKHEGIKFSCEYCGKPFSQKYNLASHIKMKHSLWLS